MPTADRGEVWLADLGIAAKIRPGLVLSVPLLLLTAGLESVENVCVEVDAEGSATAIGAVDGTGRQRRHGDRRAERRHNGRSGTCRCRRRFWLA